MKKLIVSLKNNDNCKLSKYILDKYKNLNYSTFCKALRNKDIRVNNIKTNIDIQIKNNDIIDIYITDNILYGIPKEIDYYYIDENIIIAYKKKGLLSNNEDNKITLEEPTFEEIVIKDFKNKYKTNDNIKICHRLDRNTDGLVIFSRNDKTFNEMINAFKNGYINKEYIAYVNDYKFNKKEDNLIAYLKKDSKTSFVKIYEKEEKNTEKIITSYKVLEINKKLNYAKLNITLHTGKTHQIRAHLKFIKHPIIGDSKYGNNEVNKKWKKNKQLLTAYKYSFNFKNSFLNYLNGKIIELKNI